MQNGVANDYHFNKICAAIRKTYNNMKRSSSLTQFYIEHLSAFKGKQRETRHLSFIVWNESMSSMPIKLLPMLVPNHANFVIHTHCNNHITLLICCVQG